ncbi:MAG: hypothetical protein LBQ94_03465 [Treponema sp.]|jgi:hypothetical protein|nr:hypothetical protein [Treponema sp.]
MDIKELFEKTMDEMLRLKFRVNIFEYIEEKTKINYRNFEEEIELL